MIRRNTLLATLLIALLALSVSGCMFLDGGGSTGETPPVPSGSDAPAADKGPEKPTVEEFIAADTKYGEFTLTTYYPSGDTRYQTGELWVDGDLFRYDLYEDGVYIRSIMTPDGVTAYFAQADEEISEPSVATVEHYLRQFNAPPVDSVVDGIDEETGATRILYVVQETHDMSGAANPWYTEDICYLAQDGEIIGIISRGAVPEDDGSIGDLQETRRIFSSVEVGIEIDPSVFELPFPVQDAQ